MTKYEAYTWLMQPGIQACLYDKDDLTNKALRVAIENLITCKEYAVEVFDKSSQEFIRQVDVFITYEEAEEYIRSNNLSPDKEAYGITANRKLDQRLR